MKILTSWFYRQVRMYSFSEINILYSWSTWAIQENLWKLKTLRRLFMCSWQTLNHIKRRRTLQSYQARNKKRREGVESWLQVWFWMRFLISIKGKLMLLTRDFISPMHRYFLIHKYVRRSENTKHTMYKWTK